MRALQTMTKNAEVWLAFGLSMVLYLILKFFIAPRL
jgi:hypothetical protein